MKLYRKQLNSLDELQREKKALKKKLQELEAEDGGPLSFFKGGNDLVGDVRNYVGGDNGKSMANDLLSSAGPILSTVMDLAFPILGTKVGKTLKKTVFKNVRGVAGNVIGGYLKWKAVELGTKIVIGAIRKRKNKKEYE